MERKPLIAGNWKMNKTIEEAVDLLRQLKASIRGVHDVEVVVAPPFTALKAVQEELQGAVIHLAAQHVHWEDKGAFTGEISPVMLKELGCQYVIVGHSERRQYFGESDDTVNRRIHALVAHRLKPIFCVGETLEEREGGRTFSVIERQMEGGLRNLNGNRIDDLVIAYEPVWAIGTGKTATPEQAEEIHQFIRQKVATLFSEEISTAIRIQYGGSVTPENIKGLMSQRNIDGALVGGASLTSATFSKIVRFKEM